MNPLKQFKCMCCWVPHLGWAIWLFSTRSSRPCRMWNATNTLYHWLAWFLFVPCSCTPFFVAFLPLTVFREHFFSARKYQISSPSFSPCTFTYLDSTLFSQFELISTFYTCSNAYVELSGTWCRCRTHSLTQVTSQTHDRTRTLFPIWILFMPFLLLSSFLLLSFPIHLMFAPNSPATHTVPN